MWLDSERQEWSNNQMTKSAVVMSLVILALGLGALSFVIQQRVGEQEVHLAKIEQTLSQLPDQVTVPVYTGSVLDAAKLSTISATSIFVEDSETGTTLFQLQGDEKRYPASTAKMMTALVARKIYDLDTPLTVREEAFADGSSTGFAIGEQLKVRDLLAVLLIHSGNDAAFVLANNAPGGYPRFVELMNLEAKRIGMKNTTFKNASGLDDAEQQSTAADLALLARQLLEDPLLAQLVRTKYQTVSDTSGKLTHPLVNRNELLGMKPGIIGVKTGTTNSAGENLVIAEEHDGRRKIVVMLGSKQRYPEMLQLLGWLNSNYVWQVEKAPIK